MEDTNHKYHYNSMKHRADKDPVMEHARAYSDWKMSRYGVLKDRYCEYLSGLFDYELDELVGGEGFLLDKHKWV